MIAEVQRVKLLSRLAPDVLRIYPHVGRDRPASLIRGAKLPKKVTELWLFSPNDLRYWPQSNCTFII